MKNADIFHFPGFNSIVLCISWGRTWTLPQGCTIVSWLHLPSLCIPSLPWLTTVQTCILGFRKEEAEICSLQTRNRGHRKASMPRSSTGSFSVSFSASLCLLPRKLTWHPYWLAFCAKFHPLFNGASPPHLPAPYCSSMCTGSTSANCQMSGFVPPSPLLTALFLRSRCLLWN